MIRLTELECTASNVVVRIEGNLTGENLTVLSDELQRYHAAGVTVVRLEVDGLQALSHRIATDVAWPPGQRACFVTSRAALFHMLVNYGVDVEFIE